MLLSEAWLDKFQLYIQERLKAYVNTVPSLKIWVALWQSYTPSSDLSDEAWKWACQKSSFKIIWCFKPVI